MHFNAEPIHTAIPASASSLAVPPVERLSTSRAASRSANSTIPVLSKTIIRARCTAMDSSAKRKAKQCKRAALIRKAQSVLQHVPHAKDLWKTRGVFWTAGRQPCTHTPSGLHKSFQFDVALD